MGKNTYYANIGPQLQVPSVHVKSQACASNPRIVGWRKTNPESLLVSQCSQHGKFSFSKRRGGKVESNRASPDSLIFVSTCSCVCVCVCMYLHSNVCVTHTHIKQVWHVDIIILFEALLECVIVNSYTWLHSFYYYYYYLSIYFWLHSLMYFKIEPLCSVGKHGTKTWHKWFCKILKEGWEWSGPA